MAAIEDLMQRIEVQKFVDLIEKYAPPIGPSPREIIDVEQVYGG